MARYVPLDDSDEPVEIENHWDDPEWMAQFRAHVEAECAAEDPEYTPIDDEEWEALLRIAGI